MKIAKSKDRVKELLTKLPHLRDNDNKLLASVWFYELKEKRYDLHNMTGYELLKVISEAKLSNSESIRRCRAKLQELYPELRGKAYAIRHKEKEIVKQEINSMK